jgi:hypothetical protein
MKSYNARRVESKFNPRHVERGLNFRRMPASCRFHRHVRRFSPLIPATACGRIGPPNSLTGCERFAPDNSLTGRKRIVTYPVFRQFVGTMSPLFRDHSPSQILKSQYATSNLNDPASLICRAIFEAAIPALRRSVSSPSGPRAASWTIGTPRRRWERSCCAARIRR